MKMVKKNKFSIIFWIAVMLSVFIMTTPNKEKLEELELANKKNDIYSNIQSEIIDISNTKERSILILQKKIDNIRSILSDLEKDKSYDENLKKTIGVWSSEIDVVQDEIIKQLNEKIENFKDLSNEKKVEIEQEVEILKQFSVNYSNPKIDEVLEKFEKERNSNL